MCHALLTALHFPFESTCSCKQDTKVRYWGNNFWQMERDVPVRPTEMTRPVKVDHLQSWSRILRSDTNRNFQNFWVNGKRPYNWQSWWLGVIAVKIERRRIHFSSDVFAGFRRRPRILTSLIVYRTWLCVLHSLWAVCKESERWVEG